MDKEYRDDDDRDDEIEQEEGSMKQWVQDNLRIIISVIIVVLLAAGIYSYSQRTDPPTVAQDDAEEELVMLDEEGADTASLEDVSEDGTIAENGAMVVEADRMMDEQEEGVSDEKKSMLDRVKEIAGGVGGRDDVDEEVIAEDDTPQVSSDTTSKETANAFVQTAAQGNGVTHLARGALANYLEKNPDAALTAAHKIYIEDYLQKNSGFSGTLQPGMTVEFDKDLIREATGSAKALSDAQIANLQQYVPLVPSV